MLLITEYMKPENEFNICFKNLVLHRSFDKYTGIIGYIKEYGDFNGKQ
ncbi:MAG: hypothetical protein HFG28_11830 [Eubacterium sp.]|nr:hypothetical protein [Eubacterium sp.]